MTHLTEEELVDLADGALADEWRAHLHSCRDCREQAESMVTLLGRVAEVDVPEPSPLFWDHLSQRITNAVATAAPPRRQWLCWLAQPASAWAAGLLSLALVAGLSFAVRPVTAPGRPPVMHGAAALDAPAAVAEPDDIDADQAWALVRAVADEVGWDEAHAAGLTVRPGAAERIALELSSREQSELARLIEAELKRSGA